MNTETTLRVRRATPLDAVNLYRLIVDEEKRANRDVPHSQAARIADLLAVIESGYATVAVVSGRIVGSIGAVINEMTGVVTGAWYALSPSFYDTPVPAHLLNGLVRFAFKEDRPLNIVLPMPMPGHLKSALENAGGFQPVGIMFEKKSNDGASAQEQEEPEEINADEAP